MGSLRLRIGRRPVHCLRIAGAEEKQPRNHGMRDGLARLSSHSSVSRLTRLLFWRRERAPAVRTVAPIGINFVLAIRAGAGRGCHSVGFVDRRTGEAVAVAGFRDCVKAAISAATPSPSSARNPRQNRTRRSPPNGIKPCIQRLGRIGTRFHGISFLGFSRPPSQACGSWAPIIQPVPLKEPKTMKASPAITHTRSRPMNIPMSHFHVLLIFTSDQRSRIGFGCFATFQCCELAPVLFLHC